MDVSPRSTATTRGDILVWQGTSAAQKLPLLTFNKRTNLVVRKGELPGYWGEYQGLTQE